MDTATQIIELFDGLKLKLDHERGVKAFQFGELKRFMNDALEVANEMPSTFETRMIIERLEWCLEIINGR